MLDFCFSSKVRLKFNPGTIHVPPLQSSEGTLGFGRASPRVPGHVLRCWYKVSWQEQLARRTIQLLLNIFSTWIQQKKEGVRWDWDKSDVIFGKIQSLAISCYWCQVEGIIRLRSGLFPHAIPFFYSFLFWLLDIAGILRWSELLACLGFITA